MVKKSVEQLKEDEMKILTELHDNAKKPIEAIAKRYGFSVQKVRRIIKQLEERGIIWGYTAVTDLAQMNQHLFMLLIRKTNKPLDKKTIDRIDSIDLDDLAHPIGSHVVSSHFVHGTYDWIVVFTAQDFLHGRKFSEVLNSEFPGYIKEIEIQQILYSARKQYISNPNRTQLLELM